jgi:hypothetical protein
MHNVYIHYKNLLHVSTLLGHLQGEQFHYTRTALILLSKEVPLTSQSIGRECELARVWLLTVKM